MALTTLTLLAGQQSLSIAQDDPALACGGRVDGARLEVSALDALCDWPFTVEAVGILCKGTSGFGMIKVEANGQEYGLNGSGQSQYGELMPIWAEDKKLAAEGMPGMKVNVGPWIDVGLALCR